MRHDDRRRFTGYRLVFGPHQHEAWYIARLLLRLSPDSLRFVRHAAEAALFVDEGDRWDDEHSPQGAVH